MNIGSLSSNWLLHKTILDTSRLGESNLSNQSGLTNNPFEELLEQVLLQTKMNHKSTSNLDISTLLARLDSLVPQTGAGVPQSESLSSKTTGSNNLNAHLKGVLQNTGHFFQEAGKKYNIDPALLAAISIHETGNGTSNAARFKFNVAGMMGKNGLKTYSSIEESIFDMARNLRQNYLDKGKLTIAQIGAKYAPIGAANDPTQLNNHWVTGVQRYFDTLTTGSNYA
ncbi:glucosaminidase domain-containing protein [Neobacillus niacini]|uniref:glucosaminidase domain-containing protein n=1 Tax=Neobacillus niacini TaxID=86668 RepID=UPI0009EF2127|nr:glucosaminidase domain-containing protein [Neobacillus niacini]MEC1522163.1 glucosaminidase domain-containing protein [Neobacillus niacini]